MNNTELEQLSGFNGRKSSSQPSTKKLFNEFAIDGNNGTFKKKYLKEDRVETTDEFGEKVEKYRTTQIENGKEYAVILRKDVWVAVGQGGTVNAEISEHSPSDEFVTYRNFVTKQTKHDQPNDYREIKALDKDLKLQHHLYALDMESKEVVRIILKGSSINYKKGDDYVKPFADYMNENPRPYAILTKLSAKPFKSQLGTKYFMELSKSRDLTADEMSIVGAVLKETLSTLQGNTPVDNKTEARADNKPNETEPEEYKDEMGPDDFS